MSTRTGQCLCGAVRFQAENVPGHASVCHCRMCQRWTGSAFVEVSVPTSDVTWTGLDKIRAFASSDWGERAFCTTCGSHLYFRVTQQGAFFGKTDIPLGLFDQTQGFALKAEIYIDHKPASYAFADQGQRRMTRADCVAAFPVLAEGAEDDRANA